MDTAQFMAQVEKYIKMTEKSYEVWEWWNRQPPIMNMDPCGWVQLDNFGTVVKRALREEGSRTVIHYHISTMDAQSFKDFLRRTGARALMEIGREGHALVPVPDKPEHKIRLLRRDELQAACDLSWPVFDAKCIKLARKYVESHGGLPGDEIEDHISKEQAGLMVFMARFNKVWNPDKEEWVKEE